MTVLTSDATKLRDDDFRRLGVRPFECRSLVIRDASTRKAIALASEPFQPLPEYTTELSRIATSTYRLLDPRQRTDATQRIIVGRILPLAMLTADQTLFERGPFVGGTAQPAESEAESSRQILVGDVDSGSPLPLESMPVILTDKHRWTSSLQSDDLLQPRPRRRISFSIPQRWPTAAHARRLPLAGKSRGKAKSSRAWLFGAISLGVGLIVVLGSLLIHGEPAAPETSLTSLASPPSVDAHPAASRTTEPSVASKPDGPNKQLQPAEVSRSGASGLGVAGANRSRPTAPEPKMVQEQSPEPLVPRSLRSYRPFPEAAGPDPPRLTMRSTSTDVLADAAGHLTEPERDKPERDKPDHDDVDHHDIGEEPTESSIVASLPPTHLDDGYLPDPFQSADGSDRLPNDADIAQIADTTQVAEQPLTGATEGIAAKSLEPFPSTRDALHGTDGAGGIGDLSEPDLAGPYETDMPETDVPGPDVLHSLPAQTDLDRARAELAKRFPDLRRGMTAISARRTREQIQSETPGLAVGSTDHFLAALVTAELSWLSDELESPETIARVWDHVSWIASAYKVGATSVLSDSFVGASRYAESVEAHQRLLHHGESLAESLFISGEPLHCKSVLRAARASARFLNQQSAVLLDEWETAADAMKRLQPSVWLAERRGIAKSVSSEAALVGRYRCLMQRQWDIGLPWLARSTDPRLAQVAADELSAGENWSPESRLQMARRWQNVAERQAAYAATAIHLHAIDLIRPVSQQASGTDRLEADRLLEQLSQRVPEDAMRIQALHRRL